MGVAGHQEGTTVARWLGWSTSVLALAGLAGLLAFMLMSLTRWWTLKRLGAEVIWSLSPVPAWPGITGLALILLVSFSIFVVLPGGPRVLARKVVAGAAVVVALTVGLLTTASVSSSVALRCEQGFARSVTSAVTGLDLDCVRFHYRGTESGSGLPNGPVVVVEETSEGIWTFDPPTGIARKVNADLVVSREAAIGPQW